ncbi:hypothetical protein BGW38_005236 [Lunasporangiospora selenospora]|uniref:Uncharacterized protein n=1 Tax=Lunasporangiospora selenospora TaxID=979761 RepID=A0A9P6FNP9_9FUNG|nr:hypothetical protein BGW38_005236 [Lunasporangiospora selenospora]
MSHLGASWTRQIARHAKKSHSQTRWMHHAYPAPLPATRAAIPTQSSLSSPNCAFVSTQIRHSFSTTRIARFSSSASTHKDPKDQPDQPEPNNISGLFKRPPSDEASSSVHANQATSPSPTPAEASPIDLNTAENIQSIQQIIAELNLDPKTIQALNAAESQADPSSASESSSTTDGDSDQKSETQPPKDPKKQSRFWHYLMQIFFWSALGSVPVHMLLQKGENRELRERHEWKIAVLTDMRDKLRRGESIEEEEAMLSVGMDRAKREEHVDEKYFEELLKDAESQDFILSKNSKESSSSLPTPSPSPSTTPSPPVNITRKPPPPKSEKSYL